MNTIEKRAKELYRDEHENVCIGLDNYDEQSFVVGALRGIQDQHNKDIEKAWDFISNNVDATCLDTNGKVWYGNKAFTKEDLVKAMEE